MELRRRLAGPIVLSLVAGACGEAPTGAPPNAEGVADGTTETAPANPTRPPGDEAPAACAPGALPDRDGDGWSDAVEVAVGTSPDAASDTPPARGLSVVLVPYQADPSRGVAVDVTTKLARADVGLLLDTTGSMAGTMARLGGQLPAFFAALGGLVDDVAIGLAGYGDFPMNDGANSQYDVPFYLVHRVMTVRTQAGMSSLVGAASAKNIIVNGLGPWFAGMRGGDEPEQGWEALRQAISGIGIKYTRPALGGGAAVSGSVPAFTAASAQPRVAPSGEEVGLRGGMGFRADATPIVVMISDTNNHDTSLPWTQPPSATRNDALAALGAAHARVVGLMAWKVTGHDDLAWIAAATGTKVTPDAWGSGAVRPANCPIGKCCLVADDPEASGPAVQPSPVNGSCSLVFQSDRYDTNLATMLAQSIAAISRGVPSNVTAEVRDQAGDAVDVATAFVERVVPATGAGSACAGAASTGAAFTALRPGSKACFSLEPKRNVTVPATDRAQRFDAQLAVLSDGAASMKSVDVAFVVPPKGECVAVKNDVAVR